MRKRKSNLDPHREYIRDQLAAGTSMNSIRASLAKRGSDVVYQTVRKWCLKNAKDLMDADPKRANLGRPKANRPVSLGLLPRGPVDENSIRVPKFLGLLMEPDPFHKDHYDLVCHELGIAEDGKNDPLITKERLVAWSKRMGKAHVKSLGDLDYCLLAFWSDGFPEPAFFIETLETGPWLKKLIFTASQIRVAVRKAVGLA